MPPAAPEAGLHTRHCFLHCPLMSAVTWLFRYYFLRHGDAGREFHQHLLSPHNALNRFDKGVSADASHILAWHDSNVGAFDRDCSTSSRSGWFEHRDEIGLQARCACLGFALSRAHTKPLWRQQRAPRNSLPCVCVWSSLRKSKWKRSF